MGIGEERRTVRGLRRPLVAGALLAVFACTASGAPARAPAGLELESSTPRAVKAERLDSALARVARAGDAEATAASLGVELERGRVAVEVNAAGDGAAAAEAVREAGGSVTARYRGLVEATMTPDALTALAADGRIRTVEQVSRPRPSLVVGEGVASSGASNWLAAGNAGQAVKVAVIDVGFAGWDARRDEGELSAAVATQDFCATGGFDADASDHGTAVAEVVHEVAPGARLYLICADTLATLGQAKDYAKAAGVHIVNHSVGWYNTARGDGSGGPTTPDGIAADARANGILWVNAAGNEAGNHWSGTFADQDDDRWHEFGFMPTFDEGNGIAFTEKAVEQGEFCAYLRWDDWPHSDQDYDLYLYSPDKVILVRSTNRQSGSQPPVEQLCYAIPPTTDWRSPAPDVYVSIHRFDAAETPRFDLFATHPFARPFLGGVATAESSLLEPAASPGVLTVGAVCWNDKILEPFSSRGPTIDGAVPKPDLAGPDGVSSATDGQFVDCGIGVSGSEDAGFFGTSAAAPHVAGAAAIVKQSNPTFTAAQIQAELMSRATDLGVPGPDTLYGAGMLALGAVPPELDPPPAPPANLGLPAVSGTPQQGQTLTATLGSWDGPAAVYAYQWRRCDEFGGACSAIGGALSQSYTVGAADVDLTLRVDVIAITPGGGTTATSPPTAAVRPAPPQSTSQATVSGSPRVGETLAAGIGGWSGQGPFTYSFDWQRCNPAGAACATTGASGSTYVVAGADVNSRLRVVVTASNGGGSSSSTSSATATVLPAAPQNDTVPSISGTARAGEVLVASPGSWREATSYQYRWWRCLRSTCAYVDGAIVASLTLRDADVGATFRAVVSATNAGGSTTAHSAATAPVTERLRLRAGLAASALRTPRWAAAGRRFSVTMTVVRRSGAALNGRVACTARAGGRPARLVQRTLRRGVARCAWVVPRSAARKRLIGVVRVTAAGNAVLRRFNRPIRG